MYKGFARIYVLAFEIVAYSDYKVDGKLIRELICAYQKKKTLSMEEIWNINIFMQIALVQNIKDICEKIYFSQMQKYKVENMIERLVENKSEIKFKNLSEYKTRVKSREHQAYELTNLNAEIRRVKDRIQELKELEELDFEDIEFKNGKVIHNKEINRIQFIFDTIPDEETRTILKSHGFKWSRYEKAWQRLFNKNCIYATKRILEEIKKQED